MKQTPRDIPSETFFFRDKGQFSLLRGEVLPKLIEEKKKSRTLRVWSAGCSSGEEAYSLAIVLDELLPDRAAWKIAITATDADEQLLQKARRGLYPPWSFRMMDASLLHQYFADRNGRWELPDRIRGMVDFRQSDLLAEALPSARLGLFEMDLIVCRNVLIYFQESDVQMLGKKLMETLRVGGYLVTGHGELRGHKPPGLRTIIFPESVVYERASPGREPAPALLAAAARPKSSSEFKIQPAQEHQPHGTVTAGKDLEALHESARRAAGLGHYDEAVQWCERALAVDCFSGKAYYLLAQIAEERGETETAKAMLKKVLYLDAQFVPAYIELASIYASQKDLGRAQKMRDAALKLLEQMPPESAFEMYGGLTAAELIPQVRTGFS